MELYQEIIMDHYKNPRNYGRILNADAELEDSNPLCGDKLRVSLKFGEGGVIDDLKFEGSGCAISKAAASLISEKVIGKRFEEVLSLEKADVDELIGVEVAPARTKCAMLGLSIIKKMLTLKRYE